MNYEEGTEYSMMDGDGVSDAALAEILVQSSLDGFAVIDRDYRYTLWNRAMETFAGKRASEVLGKRVFDVFPFLREHGLDVDRDRGETKNRLDDHGAEVLCDAVVTEPESVPRRAEDAGGDRAAGHTGDAVKLGQIAQFVQAPNRAEMK